MKSLVDLSGTSMLVTGGSSGIGAAVVASAERLGARVGVVDLTKPAAVENYALADISSASKSRDAVEDVCRQLGGLDVLVNNAGVAPSEEFESLSDARWRQTIAVNLDGVFRCTQSALPYLKDSRQASIVNLGSVAGRSRSRTAGVAYAATKGAVVSMTRQLAYELSRDGVRVNCVCPGLVDTQIMTQNTSPEELTTLVSAIPLKRLAAPAEIAAVVCFLASNAASYLTGSIVDVNGGLI